MTNNYVQKNKKGTKLGVCKEVKELYLFLNFLQYFLFNSYWFLMVYIAIG
jgi:hypothetical protein